MDAFMFYISNAYSAVTCFVNLDLRLAALFA
jgi:hypothetical protein